MLRITTQNEDATLVLRLEGRLHGPWVDELRNCWQRARESIGNAAIRIELVDVGFVDAAGKALLAEMHGAGDELLAQGCLAKAIRDEIVAGRSASQDRETP
jgi:ABC-type transporter Mla MlaB component